MIVGEELFTWTLRQNKSELGEENSKYRGLHPAKQRRNEQIMDTKPNQIIEIRDTQSVINGKVVYRRS